VSYFTYRNTIILMETIKDLYIARDGRSVARGAMRPVIMHDDVPAWQRAVLFSGRLPAEQ
jgi:hypothetical protein